MDDVFKREVLRTFEVTDGRIRALEGTVEVIQTDVAHLKTQDAAFDARVEDAMVRAFTRVLTWKNLSKVGTLSIGILTAYDRIRTWL